MKLKDKCNKYSTPELRNVNIPGNMKHPEWHEPTWSFGEIAEKLGITPKELQKFALSLSIVFVHSHYMCKDFQQNPS